MEDEIKVVKKRKKRAPSLKRKISSLAKIMAEPRGVGKTEIEFVENPKEVVPDKKNDNTWRVTLSEKQGKALQSEIKFLLYGGAKGGGKSWFLCIWMFLMGMKYSGNKLFFCRRRSVDFTNTTLETWKKSIPASYYRIYEQKKKIVLMNGSVIDYGGLDDPLLIQGLNSAEYAHVGVDQAEEVEQDSFGMIRGTLRHRLPDGTYPPYQVRLTANPAQCWLKQAFILNPESDFGFIPALPTDNPYLPSDYVKNLEGAFKSRPQLLAAYLHGSWDDLAGHDVCIQQSWVEKAVTKVPFGNVTKRIIVNDPARYGDDENVIYVMEEKGGLIYIAHEVILEHKSTMDTAGRLAALRKKYEAQIIAVDSIGIGAGIVDALYDLKEPVMSINSASKPTAESQQGKYFNLRAQFWMEAGSLFSEGKVSLKDDITLQGQLTIVKFEYTGNSKIKVEGKDEIKKRIGRSPDRADAFVMGLYAISQVNDLRDEEYANATVDRVGYGTRVEPNIDSEFVGAGDDYCGYNL